MKQIGELDNICRNPHPFALVGHHGRLTAPSIHIVIVSVQRVKSLLNVVAVADAGGHVQQIGRERGIRHGH